MLQIIFHFESFCYQELQVSMVYPNGVNFLQKYIIGSFLVLVNKSWGWFMKLFNVIVQFSAMKHPDKRAIIKVKCYKYLQKEVFISVLPEYCLLDLICLCQEFQYIQILFVLQYFQNKVNTPRKSCMHSEFLRSVFSRILIRIFSVFSQKAGKKGPKNLRIQPLFTQ